VELADERIFRPEVWGPALEQYAGVVQLPVHVYAADGRLLYGPVGATPLFTKLASARYDPGLADCARAALRSDDILTVRDQYRLGMAGVPLHLDGRLVAAGVIGYGLLGFPEAGAIQKLARNVGLPFAALWREVRHAAPASVQRLRVAGGLLRVLGEGILGETSRARQHEELSERLAEAAGAKDRFLAVLSHELRAPLTPILAWAQMLEQETDPARIRQGAKVIARNVRFQAALVDDLLDLTRIARESVRLSLSPQDLRESIRSALDTIGEPVGQKGLRVEWDEPPDPVLVGGDPARLDQVFRNVLSNAAKFTGHGTIHITLGVEGRDAVVRVRDTGIGIAPAFLPFAFDMFRQEEEGTRREYGGLGLGLAIAKRVMELHGGAITLTSAGRGHGAEATIRLPRLDSRPEAVAPSRSDTSGASTLFAGLRVLLVEDDADTCDATKLFLESLGARVAVARDGILALEAVSREEPDVVLCDLRMPRLDGVEFVRRLRGKMRAADVPVIAVTGYGSADDRHRTRAAGFDGHLTKPFDVTSLISALQSARRQPA